MVEIIVSAITAVVAIIVAIITGRNNERLKRIEIDSAATREQTENEHADAEYSNLREELTATRMALKSLAEAQERQLDALEGYVRDVDKSVRAARHSADRQADLVDSRFQEIPGLIDTHIATHVMACPLRATQKLITE